MSNSSAIQMVVERGWRSGLANMLNKELSAWWHTRKWWIQGLVWIFALNGLLALPIWLDRGFANRGLPAAHECLRIFMSMFGPFASIGVAILMQSAIVGEKKSGTASWMLSNPVSRASFVISKLIANAIGILAVVVTLQGVIAYLQISLRTGIHLPVIHFVAAMALQSLGLLFYLTLTLMLGALFSARGPVIGIPIALLIGEDLISAFAARSAPWLPMLLPNKLSEMAIVVAVGQPLPSIAPIVSSVVFSILFMVVAIWRFRREEF